MNFLLKVALAAGMAGSVMAAPDGRGLPAGIENDGVLLNDEKTDRKTEADILSDLNHSYTITNPYTTSGDQPFAISQPENLKVAAPTATRVSCGGQIWTHGELLGRSDNGTKDVRTRIHENRVYLDWGGEVPDNIYILFHLEGTKYPNNPTNDKIIWDCVNPIDPSIRAQGLLGKTADGKITCAGYVMEDREELGSFWDGGRETIQYTKYVDGLLRIMIQQGRNDHGTDFLNMTLMKETINGEHGSYLVPKWRGKFTHEMLNGCYWPTAPKYATLLPDSNCPSGPSLSGTSSISQTALTFTFTGSGVNTVKWKIKSNNQEVASGTTPDLNGAKSARITYNSLTPGNYVLEIEGANCTSGVSQRSFTIETPGIPNCSGGPSITSISNITGSTATVAFAGTNLQTFSWRVYQGNSTFGSGNTGYLSTKSVNIEYPYLAKGTYTLEITPQDCKGSVATRTFTMSANDTRSACPEGPRLEYLINSGETNVEFRFHGDGIYAIDWKVMQGSNLIRANRVAPQNNHPVAQFSTLPQGQYTFEIQGGNCKSATTSARFAVGTSLPIYISDFKGESVAEGVELSWEVVAEEGGKEFEVLRYDDKMKNETVLGKVALTDQRTGLYKFIDTKPLLGMSYYQLKQIDYDGSFTKSKIVAINPIALTGQIAAPNPARDYVDVQFSARTAGQTDVKIYTVSGVLMGKSKIDISAGKNVHRVNVQNLNAGKYIMRISHGGEESVLRFLKVN